MFGRNASQAAPGTGKERFATLIGEGTTIQGELTLAEGVRIDGRIDGHVRRRGDAQVTVVVGPKGCICGDVEASRVVVAGTVQGAVRADVEVELQATAVVEGDVHCRSLQVAHGARLNGRIHTTEPVAATPKPVLVSDQTGASKAA